MVPFSLVAGAFVECAMAVLVGKWLASRRRPAARPVPVRPPRSHVRAVHVPSSLSCQCDSCLDAMDALLSLRAKAVLGRVK